jgi:hypothetical protein
MPRFGHHNRKRVDATMTKYFAFLVAAALTAGACANESAQSLTGPTSITSSAAATDGSQQVKRYALTGIVDSIVKPSTPLRNARVQIRSGADAGRFAVTDSNGGFVLNGLAADRLAVTVSLDGYATWATTVDLFSDVELEPKLEPLQ